jgi:hypothetical protein
VASLLPHGSLPYYSTTTSSLLSSIASWALFFRPYHIARTCNFMTRILSYLLSPSITFQFNSTVIYELLYVSAERSGTCTSRSARLAGLRVVELGFNVSTFCFLSRLQVTVCIVANTAPYSGSWTLVEFPITSTAAD